jgi:MscS family membrane protein
VNLVMKTFAEKIFSFDTPLYYTALEILGVLVVTFLLTLFLKKFYQKPAHDHELRNIYKIIAYALKVPIKICIWGFCSFYLILIINEFLHFHIGGSLLLMKKILFIVVIAIFLLKALDQYELFLKNRHRETHIPIAVLCRVLKIIAIVFPVIAVIQTIGIDISGILAFGSVSGIIIGFASKDLLANFFGATLIYLDKPFEVGDAVRSPDKNIEGIVESISWRLTKIRTFEKRPIYVPNSVFNSIILENTSRMSHRRIHETMRIRYEDINAAEKIITDIKMLLKNHKDIDADQIIAVNLEFGHSSIDLVICAFTKVTEWAQYRIIKQNILTEIWKIIGANEAEIAVTK